ncbi:uncharacterized protein B0I36DRAFT_332365 [Microdochium trichocladiopsis]|uniref:Uncharacterized protein n=1 Tax=Microdochium trichocladiopsis TaxID=1682393 RepID=A0A9P8XY93_9PEZI|nr:uncharacterized protein B0I36DRAFT_332365 [Microdochium trichocladiopsis]KAH7024992.1 hypothetical protein B0I36DRAFT_332365 [Microdochium trichocladiopsis]
MHCGYWNPFLQPSPAQPCLTSRSVSHPGASSVCAQHFAAVQMNCVVGASSRAGSRSLQPRHNTSIGLYVPRDGRISLPGRDANACPPLHTWIYCYYTTHNTMGQQLTTCAQPAVGTCTAHPYSLYSLTAYNSIATSLCAPVNSISYAAYPAYAPVGATACGEGCCGPCKAYIAQLSTTELNPGTTGTVVLCNFYDSQLPATATTCSDAFPYDYFYAYYRDDAQGCFASSTAAASRFCSYVLDRATSTVVVYTGTSTGPAQTSTFTSVVTSGVCEPQSRIQGAAQVAQQTGFPILAENKDSAGAADADVEAAAPFPKTTAPPVPLEQRAVPPAPAPACLDTVAFPRWNYLEACNCLLTDATATTQRTLATTPGPVVTTVRSTVTTTVQKSVVATFRAEVGVPRNQQQQQQQPKRRSFPLVSRKATDAAGNERRIFMYRKGHQHGHQGNQHQSQDHESDDKHGKGVSMHVNSQGKLFTVSRQLNYLRPFGQVTLVKLQGGLTVLGQLAKDTPAGSDDALYDCVVPQTGGSVQCRLVDGTLAVFSEVQIPGGTHKHARAIAVGRRAVKGARVVSLNVGATGTVLVGCGGGGQ